MGFRNATSCSCCEQEPCECECPDTLPETVIGDAIVTIDGFSPGSPYECGICESVNGEFALINGAQPSNPGFGGGECFFDPKILPSTTCLGHYDTQLTGNWDQIVFFCGSYEPLILATQNILARTYCAYEKDGKIYRPETKPEGAKLIGRAIEVRMCIIGNATGVYIPGDYNCYAVRPKESLYTTSFDQCFYAPGNYDGRIYCCDVELYVPSTMGSNCFNDCVLLDPFPGPIGPCPDPNCYIVYGFWAWRTIIATKRKCHGLSESLSLITDEEELSREYLFLNRRLRAPIGEDDCQTFKFCQPPTTIHLEI